MKRGQAMMEYLATYGWILLILAIVLGTLMSFGVINPKIWKNTKCWADAGISCKNAYDIDNNIQVDLYNNFRQDITVKGASYTITPKGGTSCGPIPCGSPSFCGLGAEPWTPGSKKTMSGGCNGVSTSQWATMEFTFTYRTDLGKYDKVMTGKAEVKLAHRTDGGGVAGGEL